MAWDRKVVRGARRVRVTSAPPRGRIMALIGGVAVLLVALGDVLTSPDVVLIGLTLLGPLLASLAAPWRETAAVAALAFVVAFLLGLADAIFLTEDHVIRLAVVGVGGALCVYAAAQREQRQRAMQRLAHVAEVAQEVMLRPPPAVLDDVALAGRYLSASDEALIGGDLYETAFTPYGVRVIVGDVCGKGLEGIRLAAVVLAAFRESVWDRDLADLARTIDKRVTKEATSEDFVTAVLAEFPPDGGVTLVNCGHPPPLRLRAGEAIELAPAEASLPLGLEPEVTAEHHSFADGDRLLICTDGLFEARDGAGDFFPVMAHLDTLTRPDPQRALDGLLEALLEHVGGRLDDDLAVLLAERRP